MRIYGIGLDLVEVRRLGGLIDRWGDRFIGKVFTPAEADYCLRGAEPQLRFAARFAAKEAVAKALGTGIGRHLRWLDMEIGHQAGGAPRLELGGAGLDFARGCGIDEVLLTLTHTRGYAAAHAMAVGGRAAPGW
jgi:holo-[acyl-carrier protein] synthase